ncbi:MAG: GTP-binding protein [Spongiibacteraceae bacterium]|nr:GTP-binding protein [Spongiibacteraceae bacterium]
MSVLKAIPTNVITGFLGVGKSTAIVHLLKQKPHNERWAVLVNEFGEVGIDGGLIHGNNKAEQGITIREVPGGCMCCTAGLPMQMAPNSLLTRAKPQRLLIEPSGLGHPKEVLDTLSSPHYRSVLDMRATVTLVDARKMLDERYTDHQSFNQQLEIADIIVANKADQYQNKDFPALLKYLENKQWLHKHSLYQTQKGQLKHEWLMPASAYEGSNHPPLAAKQQKIFLLATVSYHPAGIVPSVIRAKAFTVRV